MWAPAGGGGAAAVVVDFVAKSHPAPKWTASGGFSGSAGTYDECVKLSLAKGPRYIVGSPIVLAIKDGVVECVVENADDIPALEACLGFGTEGR